ncbi:hypothetical protein PSAB6_60250 [Paraburkholderia sabiae]|nr:hypothetical protein PSAB6_60250 [Paraburkholderia sabiae]
MRMSPISSSMSLRNLLDTHPRVSFGLGGAAAAGCAQVNMDNFLDSCIAGET